MLFAALFSLIPSSAAQQTAPPTTDFSKPPIKVTTRLVILNVVVKDKSGNFVPGLTQGDFQVLESNQPQTIAYFEPPTDPASSTIVNSASADASSGASAVPRTILVLDQLNTKSEDIMFAKEKIRSFLFSQPARLSQPTSLFSLNKRRMDLLAGPTQDRETLLRALGKSIIELPPVILDAGGVQGGADCLLTSLLALDELALSSANEQRRKNVVWIGNGIPILSDRTANLADLARFQEWVHYTANWLQETQTTVYTVDPRGLEVAPAGFISGVVGAIIPLSLTPSELVFESIAPESGGTITRQRNDVDVAIASAVRDGSLYYTLSYYPANQVWDSKFRPIRVVVVDRPGLTARTQLGYYAFPEGFEGGAAQIEFGLSRAVMSPIPFRSIDFTATAQILPGSKQLLPASQRKTGVSGGSKVKGSAANLLTARVSFAINRESLSWTPQAGGDQRSEITVVTSSIGSSGRVLGYRVREEEIILQRSKCQDPESRLIKVWVQMSLPAKTDHLRLVVRDADSGHLGTFDLPASAFANTAGR